ncbi:MarR family winged helix-turn-helix transcriptional regulator [Actinomycetospora sp. CA-101289]|uniref:MarR family winged helix-turn-helix transcriptional regulator n=1 Tax=Actinomycetospora sp. CA-101289 TaxID=3239893 RepID=UPI003D98E88E
MPESESGPPLGRLLTTTAREVSRAFDTALAAAGGSRSTWLVLLALTTRRTASQRELAVEVGIQGATLTHHLNGMEADGLLTRRRDPENRRVHLVELTDAGRDAFARLRGVAQDHDRRLHAGLDPDDLAAARRVLTLLRTNVGADTERV